MLVRLTHVVRISARETLRIMHSVEICAENRFSLGGISKRPEHSTGFPVPVVAVQIAFPGMVAAAAAAENRLCHLPFGHVMDK